MLMPCLAGDICLLSHFRIFKLVKEKAFDLMQKLLKWKNEPDYLSPAFSFTPTPAY